MFACEFKFIFVAMKKWFNILPDGDNACKILLYGYISDWEDDASAKAFVTELSNAESRYQKINVHINSGGGSVYEGLAIFNTLRGSSADITIYIDGVAASMGSVIALCGKPLYMNRYSRLMIHGVQGGAYGTPDEMETEAKEARSLETDLISIISERTGLSIDNVKAKWFDGKDHWFTAQEALDANLINGIFDGVKPKSIPTGKPKAATLFHVYNALLNQITDMNKLFKKLGFTGQADEDQLIEKVDAIEAQAQSEKAKAERLEQENTILKAKLQEKEDAEKAAQAAQVTAVLDEAVKSHKIQESQKAHFEAVLKNDFNNGKAIIDSLPVMRRAVNDVDPGGNTDPYKDFTFSDYQKKAPKVLAEMKASNPERFKALYKNQYGTEPKI